MKVFAVLGVAAALATATPALAAPGEGPRGFGPREPREFSAESCAEHQTRLSARLTGIESRHDAMEAREAQVIERLTTLADEADAAGLDSSTLRANLETFADLADALDADYQDWHDAISEALTLDCDTATEDEAKAMRDRMRAAHDELRGNAEAMRAFVHETLKPDAKALRQALEGESEE